MKSEIPLRKGSVFNAFTLTSSTPGWRPPDPLGAQGVWGHGIDSVAWVCSRDMLKSGSISIRRDKFHRKKPESYVLCGCQATYLMLINCYQWGSLHDEGRKGSPRPIST